MQDSVKQWPRPQLTGLIAAVALASGVLLAACGGGSASPGVASVGSSTSSASTAKSASGTKDPLAISRCMRSHGVPNFPDASSGGAITIGSATGINPNSPAFKTAMTACRPLFPGGHPSPAQQAQHMAQALAFSRCMRSHGLPQFPDPSGQGAIQLRDQKGSGLDPSSPQFQTGQKACQHLMGAPKGGPVQSSSPSHGSGSGAVIGIGG